MFLILLALVVLFVAVVVVVDFFMLEARLAVLEVNFRIGRVTRQLNELVQQYQDYIDFKKGAFEFASDYCRNMFVAFNHETNQYERFHIVAIDETSNAIVIYNLTKEEKETITIGELYKAELSCKLVRLYATEMKDYDNFICSKVVIFTERGIIKTVEI